MFAGTHIDPRTGVEILSFRHTLCYDDVLRAFADIRERLQPNTRRLWDFRRVTVEMTAEELSALGHEARARDQPGARAALLVDNRLNFAICRQHLAWRDSEHVATAVFMDHAEALAWLLEFP